MSKWRREYCPQRPDEVDFTSSPGHVIERKNIVEVEAVDEETGNPVSFYECDMRYLPTQEYLKNIKTLQNAIDVIEQENIELTFALADVYEELLPEREKMLADFYVKLVEVERCEIDDVPAKVKGAVKDELQAKGIIGKEGERVVADKIY